MIYFLNNYILIYNHKGLDQRVNGNVFMYRSYNNLLKGLLLSLENVIIIKLENERVQEKGSMEKQELQEENQKLIEIIRKYKEVIQYYHLRLEAIPKLYKNNPKMLENLLNSYAEKLDLMKKNIQKPYFARIDFARDGEEKIEQLYIGKVGVMDEENNHITIDWRAPISSIYYDSNIGRTSYQAPEGTCTGELLVKRQYEIEERKIKALSRCGYSF